MEEVNVDQEIFHKFRSVCLSLLQCPSSKGVADLQKLVGETESQDLQIIQEHVLFPMQVYLKKPTENTNYTISVMEFIQYFYSRTTLQSYFILKDVLNSLLALAAGSAKAAAAGGGTEDLRLGIVRCLASMVKSASRQVAAQFCHEENRLPISHLVFVALEWAEAGQSPPLIKSSCIALLEVLLSRRSGDFVPVYLGLLPGISSRLVKVCQDPGIVQASIKAAAVRTWTGYVTALMADSVLSGVMTKDFEDNAKIQLETQYKALQGMNSHSDRRVRDAIFDSAESLMKHCWSRLDNLKFYILNTLIINNENDCNKEDSQTLDIYVEKSKSCIENLCLEVNNVLHKLNKDLESGLGLFTTEKLEELLALLLGYIKFQEKIETSSSFFISRVHVDKMMQNLVSLAQLEDTRPVSVLGIKLIEGKDSTLPPLVNAVMSQDRRQENGDAFEKPQKPFRHLTTKKLDSLFCAVCRRLGRTESRSLVIDYLLQRVGELQVYKREAMLVLNLVVLGATDSDDDHGDGDNLADICLPVLELYLEMCPASRTVAVKGQTTQVKESQEDSWTEFLLSLEGIGYVMKNNVNKFDHLMPEILFHAISNVSPSSGFSSTVLYFVLEDLAAGCGRQTILHMMEDHVDHVARLLNMNLRQRRVSAPGLEILLSLIMKISHLQGSCSIQQDILDSVNCLTLNLSISEPQQVLAILTLILVIVTNFQENFQPKANISKEESDEGFLARMIQDLENEKKKETEEMREIEEQLKDESASHDEVKEEAEEPAEEMEEDNTDCKKEVGYDKQFLQTCLCHVQHFVSMQGQPAWQVTSLQIISVCLDLLATTPDESPGQRQELFLPLVHQVWSSLHLLFKSTNIFIVDKAFSCLLVIATHSRDFVHKRVVTYVLPSLLKFFRTMDTLAKDKERQRTLAGRESRRILEKLVTGLWDLLHLLDLSPIEADPVIQMITDSLEGQQSKEEVTTFLKPKRNLDANILELKLTE